MKKMLFILLLLCLSSNAFAQNKGVLLENLTWQEAEKALKPETVVVIPLGAAAKEHGPHLKLKNDWTMAEYYKRRVLKAADVVIAPTVNYHFLDFATTGNRARSDRGHLPQPGSIRPSPILCDQHRDSDDARVETGGGYAGGGRHTASLPGSKS
jgi:hypothetical protein